ncbi:MAG: iron dependent repressor, metal binding and dimerization domain protein [Thermotaleaceae bacterium]
MLSPSLEDYLEEIYQLSVLKNTIRVRDIADRLNVSSPSVVKALNKLFEEKYIHYEKYGEITLTPKGNNLGRLLVKRNSLLQEFLNVIHSSCDRASEAEAMEHYLSPPTISAIENLIEFMKQENIKKMFDSFNTNKNRNHWSNNLPGE